MNYLNDMFAYEQMDAYGICPWSRQSWEAVLGTSEGEVRLQELGL